MVEDDGDYAASKNESMKMGQIANKHQISREPASASSTFKSKFTYDALANGGELFLPSLSTMTSTDNTDDASFGRLALKRGQPVWVARAAHL